MTQTSKQTVFSMIIVGLFLALFLALPSDSHAMVLSDNDSTPGTASSSNPSVRPVRDLSCAQAVVRERETSIMKAWTSFNTDMVSALTKRTDALVAAWKMTDDKDRATTIKSVWATWKIDSKKAHTELKADRKAAWAEFKKTIIVECKEKRLPREGQD